MADEATNDTEVNRANKADAANKPDEADEAKGNAFDKAKANEADKAIVVDEIDEAIVADEIEADVIGDITAANKAIMIDEVIAVGVTKDAEVAVKASKAVEVEVDEVDKSNTTNKADEADVTTADEADYAIGADVFVKAVDSDKAEDAKAVDAAKNNKVADKADAKADEATWGSKTIATAMKPKSPVNETVDPTIRQN